MSEIVWLPEAVEDLSRLRTFLVDKSPNAAKRAAQIILGSAKRIADHPEIGKPMNDGTGRRELFQPFGAGGYVLRYVIEDQTVFIVRAWHTKEQRE